MTDAGTVLCDFLENVWNAHDLGRFPEYVSPHVRLHPPRGEAVGFDGYRRMAEAFLLAYPDLHFDVAKVVVDGDEASARIRITGTQTGPWRGLLPSGRRVAVVGRPWCRVRDGKIVEFWQLFDELGMAAQAGHVPDERLLGGHR